MSLCQQLAEPHHPDSVRLSRLFDVMRCNNDRCSGVCAAQAAAAAMGWKIEQVSPDGGAEQGINSNLKQN